MSEAARHAQSEGADASSPPSRRGRLIRSALAIVVFVAVGPIIGLLVFAFGFGAGIALSGKEGGAAVALFLLLYGWLFAHYFGALWALLAGLAATILAATTRRTSLWIGPVSGAVSLAGAAVAGQASFPSPPSPPEGAVFDGFDYNLLLLITLVHVISATLCWAMTRRLLDPEPVMRTSRTP